MRFEHPSSHLLLRLTLAVASVLVTSIGVPPALAAKDARTANTIAFWDEANGLAGAGRPYRTDSHGGVLKTTDGGRTFRIVLRTKQAVNWVDTAGTSEAWATAGRGEATRLWHTVDAGETWQRLPRAHAWGTAFWTPTDGLAVGGEAAYYDMTSMRTRLLTTSDGGTSWRSLPDPCPAFYYVSVSAPSPDAAWSLCTNEGGAGLQEKAVFRSADGGQTWMQLARTDFDAHDGGLGLIDYPLGISMSAEGFGFIWGVVISYTSRDGGSNWKPVRRRMRLSGVTSASILSDSVGYVLEAEGRRDLSLTRDGGRHWTRVHRFPRLK